MQSELQILEEKFKDIKARLGVAVSIIEEAERVFSRVRLEAGKLSEEKASFVEFVKNETLPNIEEDKRSIIDYLKSDQKVGRVSSHFEDILFHTSSDKNYLDWLLKDMQKDGLVKYEGLYVELLKVDVESIVIAPEKRLTSDYILKYLTGKPNGATLKQIQSRFKGYSGNKCKEIAVLVTGESGLQILFSGEHFSQSVVQIRKEGDTHDTYHRVKSILVDTIDVDERLVESSSLLVEDFGADSLDLAEILMAIEEEFRIEVPDEEAEKVKTVDDIVRYVESKLTEFGGGKYGDSF